MKINGTHFVRVTCIPGRERERERGGDRVCECEVCALYRENRPEDCNIAYFFFFWHDMSFLLELIILKGNIL